MKNFLIIRVPLKLGISNSENNNKLTNMVNNMFYVRMCVCKINHPPNKPFVRGWVLKWIRNSRRYAGKEVHRSGDRCRGKHRSFLKKVQSISMLGHVCLYYLLPPQDQ